MTPFCSIFRQCERIILQLKSCKSVMQALRLLDQTLAKGCTLRFSSLKDCHALMHATVGCALAHRSSALATFQRAPPRDSVKDGDSDENFWLITLRANRNSISAGGLVAGFFFLLHISTALLWTLPASQAFND